MPGAFLYDNKVLTAVGIGSFTASASTPPAYLLDPQPRRRMRSVGTQANALIDLGGQVDIECVAIIGTNCPVGSVVRVRLATADVTGVAGDAWDTGAILAQTALEASGNVVLIRSSAATGRYLLVELVTPANAVTDVGVIAAGPLWRMTRAQSYGFREGRIILDRRDRNALTAAEFPVPALLNPRFAAFQVALMSNSEAIGEQREMLFRLGAVRDALWIPDTGLSQAELNRRSIWGAVAQPGEDAGVERPVFPGWSRAWRVIERG